MSRPELTGHASLFYDAREAKKYDSSSRMVGIQREITERAIELLKLDDDDGRNDVKRGGGSRHGRPRFVLDVGCGSGLSGQVRRAELSDPHLMSPPPRLYFLRSFGRWRIGFRFFFFFFRPPPFVSMLLPILRGGGEGSDHARQTRGACYIFLANEHYHFPTIPARTEVCNMKHT